MNHNVVDRYDNFFWNWPWQLQLQFSSTVFIYSGKGNLDFSHLLIQRISTQLVMTNSQLQVGTWLGQSTCYSQSATSKDLGPLPCFWCAPPLAGEIDMHVDMRFGPIFCLYFPCTQFATSNNTQLVEIIFDFTSQICSNVTCGASTHFKVLKLGPTSGGWYLQLFSVISLDNSIIIIIWAISHPHSH